MSTIKIEFPAGDRNAARIFGAALAEYADTNAYTHAAEVVQERIQEEPGKSAASATEQGAGTATGQGNGSDAPLDTKGVAFHIDYCGEAKEPFYSSGPRTGQWKKKRGLNDATYDAWYAGELAKLAGAPAEQEPVNTANAFGGAAGPGAPQRAAAPTDTGVFMAWVSEKQAAGALTQDQINNAWTQAGVAMGDLFGKPPEEIAASIKKVYDILVAIEGV